MARASLRDEIFEAGQAEFHERGYTATGIAGITTRAAAPKGSFYNHFSSKEDLAVEALGAYAASQHLDVLEDPELSPADRLRAHFEFMADAIGGAPVINGCMIANFAAESSDETPLIREQIAGIYTKWSALITRNLQAGRRHGGHRGRRRRGAGLDTSGRLRGSGPAGPRDQVRGVVAKLPPDDPAAGTVRRLRLPLTSAPHATGLQLRIIQDGRSY